MILARTLRIRRDDVKWIITKNVRHLHKTIYYSAKSINLVT